MNTEVKKKEEKSAKQEAGKVKKKSRKTVSKGIVSINASFNNTIVTISDSNGNALTWSSAGACGFKGSRKSTPYAAQVATEKAAKQAADFGLISVDVLIKGVGAGRESALRALQTAGFNISSIRDLTGVPHNGCRAPKRRRV
ncbi:MAG TPA: 30S ribosomal protein S11 [Alphaproteobacteria bacterium]|nr:30S ribosomal protein S11 [Alphaproteobacteria bacterium]